MLHQFLGSSKVFGLDFHQEAGRAERDGVLSHVKVLPWSASLTL